MIYGLVMKCDNENCQELVLEKLDNVSHVVKGERITFNNRYICNGCIARNELEVLRGGKRR